MTTTTGKEAYTTAGEYYKTARPDPVPARVLLFFAGELLTLTMAAPLLPAPEPLGLWAPGR